MATVYIIKARDTTYREDREVIEVLTESEAKQWQRQFNREYLKEDGYKVTVTKKEYNNAN